MYTCKQSMGTRKNLHPTAQLTTPVFACFDDPPATPLAGSRVWSRREEKWALEEKEMEVTAEEERKKTQERQREMQRRMNPTTVQDFEVKADGASKRRTLRIYLSRVRVVIR